MSARLIIPFTQVDAFADRPFTGNPAAVMPLAAWLDDATLLAIAGENNLSETAFLVPDPTGSADYALRWFTPAGEVALCGHATLASGHIVLSSDPERASVSFSTRQAGILTVTRGGPQYELALPAWRPVARPLPAIVEALGLTSEQAPTTLWHDKGYALVVAEDEALVRGATPDMRALARHERLVVVLAAPGAATDVVARVFTPYYAIDEDPVTGSAHAVMVPWWAERLGRDAMTSYQASARGGHIACRLAGETVILGGACVTVIEGRFNL